MEKQQSIIESDEPEFIEMDIPARPRYARTRCSNRLRIEAMPVNPKRMLFFRLPKGMDAKLHGERLRKLCCTARKASDNQKEFVTRRTKSGVVRGFGIWRVK